MIETRRKNHGTKRSHSRCVPNDRWTMNKAENDAYLEEAMSGIPEMSQGRHSNLGTVFFAVGFSVMMVLDVALG